MTTSNLYTTKQIAQVFGKTTRTIMNWANDGFPIADNSNLKQPLFDPPKCVNWFVAKELEKKSVGGKINLDEQKSRKAFHDANIAELKEQQLNQELVKIDEAIELWTETLTNVSTALDNLPKQAHLLVGIEDRNEAENVLIQLVNITKKSVRDYQPSDYGGKDED